MSESPIGSKSRKELRSSSSLVQIGAWLVNPSLDEISSNGASVKLEPRTMRLLVYLMEHRDRVVGQQELLDHIWVNVVVTPQSVYSTIAQLRQALGDSSVYPSYIATVPRKGYCLVAAVSALPMAAASGAPPATIIEATNTPADQLQPASPGPSLWRLRLGFAALAIAICILMLILLRTNRESHLPAPSASIAVLPFLDLTEKQDSQYLADGVTEELIDILAHNAALHVPARTSSFYFKSRSETVATIARQLNVAYLLEGSVRRSDAKIRVTAQLIRAADGFHMWSETYTRDGEDVLAVEDDIAQAVAAVLRTRLTPSVNPGTTIDATAHNLLLECNFIESGTPLQMVKRRSPASVG